MIILQKIRTQLYVSNIENDVDLLNNPQNHICYVFIAHTQDKVS